MFGSQCQLIPGYQGLVKLARTSIGQALSIEALDEIYAQAEDFVAGDDLEQLLRAYRSRKAALTPSPQLSPSSPIRGVVNSPSV
jgi:recombinational DNA repair protein RecT